jgi:excisionase family DNA binding protein
MTRLHVPEEVQLFSPKEIAKKLGVAYPVVLQYMKEGRMKYYELSEKKRKISNKHLKAFLKECEK